MASLEQYQAELARVRDELAAIEREQQRIRDDAEQAVMQLAVRWREHYERALRLEGAIDALADLAEDHGNAGQ